MISTHPPHVHRFFQTTGMLVSNLGLVLEKFIPWTQDRRGVVAADRREYFDRIRQLFPREKVAQIQPLEAHPSPPSGSNGEHTPSAPTRIVDEPREPAELPEFAKAYLARWEGMLSMAPLPVRTLHATALWHFRLYKSPSEIAADVAGIHSSFPVPVIKGNAIKGAFRSYCEQYMLPDNELTEQDVVRLLGTSPDAPDPSQGSLRFFDALPTTGGYFMVDARTCQHDGYHSGNEHKLGTDNVIPLFFISVPRGTQFLFALGSFDQPDLDLGITILRRVLRKGGIGRATHVGYGYFEADVKKSGRETSD